MVIKTMCHNTYITTCEVINQEKIRTIEKGLQNVKQLFNSSCFYFTKLALCMALLYCQASNI